MRILEANSNGHTLHIGDKVEHKSGIYTFYIHRFEAKGEDVMAYASDQDELGTNVKELMFIEREVGQNEQENTGKSEENEMRITEVVNSKGHVLRVGMAVGHKNLTYRVELNGFFLKDGNVRAYANLTEGREDYDIEDIFPSDASSVLRNKEKRDAKEIHPIEKTVLDRCLESGEDMLHALADLIQRTDASARVKVGTEALISGIVASRETLIIELDKYLEDYKYNRESKEVSPETESLLKRAFNLLTQPLSLSEDLDKWVVDYALMSQTPIEQRLIMEDGKSISTDSGYVLTEMETYKEMLSCLLMSYSHFSHRPDMNKSRERLRLLIDRLGGMEKVSELAETAIHVEMTVSLPNDAMMTKEGPVPLNKMSLNDVLAAKGKDFNRVTVENENGVKEKVCVSHKVVHESEGLNLGKQPIGVMPRYLHDEQRQKALASAITRYAKNGYTVNQDWIEEFNELCNRINSDKKA